jgi:hypothetical protein
MSFLAAAACGAQQEDDVFLEEAHAAVRSILADGQAVRIVQPLSFTFPEEGLVCGNLVGGPGASDQVYAYQSGEGAAVGFSIRYDRLYERCLAAREEREKQLVLATSGQVRQYR